MHPHPSLVARNRLWTALPSLPLRNIGTPLVESAEHYAIRLAWTAGISIRELVRLASPYDEPGTHGINLTSSFCGPGKIYKRRIENLEALTGVENIRCGSFWVLDNLLSKGAVARKAECRRWCPRCFKYWDHELSCEPLLWSVDLTVSCPVHGCDLEDRCGQCGSRQRNCTNYEKRRICRKCKNPLAGEGFSTMRTDYSRWMDHQITELVCFCATPNQPVVDGNTFKLFVQAKRRSDPSRHSREAFHRIARADGDKVRLDTLLHACAFQGASVTDLLLQPTMAGTESLALIWRGFKPLELPKNSADAASEAVEHCLALISKGMSERYIPHPRNVLREMNTMRRNLSSSSRTAFEQYLLLYRQQCSVHHSYASDRLFKQVLCFMRIDQRNPFTSPDAKKSCRRLTKAFGLSQEQAHEMYWCTMKFRRAVETAKSKALRLSASEFRVLKRIGHI